MTLSSLIEKCKKNSTSKIVEISENGTARQLSYEQLAKYSIDLAQQLKAIGLVAGHQIALLSPNSIEWIIWDLATLQLGIQIKSLPADTEINDCKDFMQKNSAALLVSSKYSGPDKNLITSYTAGDQLSSGYICLGGSKNTDTDLHTYTYSSGTTGALKGIKISKNGTNFVINKFITDYEITPNDCHIIFLPFSNYQQRLSVYGCLASGANLILCSYQKIFHVMRDYSPTFLIAPPIFYDTALQLKNSGAKSLSSIFGNNLRFLITGMAPIKHTTMQAYWSDGIQLLEAYGLTETGMVAWNKPSDYKIGTLGRPLDRSHILIETDGEIYIKRPYPLSSGYFDAEHSESNDTFMNDGIIATGDYGSIDDAGYLKLLGRKKDIIVTNSGQKFHPEEVENKIRALPNILDAIITTNKINGAVVALIYISSETKKETALAMLQENNSFLEPHKRTARFIFINETIRDNKSLYTRNMKINRNSIYEFYKNDIERQTHD
jgi:long-chain acyl-CoA synthetase